MAYRLLLEMYWVSRLVVGGSGVSSYVRKYEGFGVYGEKELS